MKEINERSFYTQRKVILSLKRLWQSDMSNKRQNKVSYLLFFSKVFINCLLNQ